MNKKEFLKEMGDRFDCFTKAFGNINTITAYNMFYKFLKPIYKDNKGSAYGLSISDMILDFENRKENN